MNLQQMNLIHAGGPGSGPNAPCPQCGPHGGKTISEGDTVKMKSGAKVFNPQTGERYDFPKGTKLTVVHVLPKVGNADQIVSVTTGGKHEDVRPTAYANMADLELHKSGITHQVTPVAPNELPLWSNPKFHPQVKEWKKLDIQPVPKSKVVTRYKSADGANVTVVKPADDKSETSTKNLATTESRFKGKFQLMEKVEGADGQTTRIYDSSNIPATGWKREGGSAASKPGATVWVHRYANKVVIQEQSYTRWSGKTKGLVTFRYKNIGKAFGMMKRRYGISIKLSKGRF